MNNTKKNEHLRFFGNFGACRNTSFRSQILITPFYNYFFFQFQSDIFGSLNDQGLLSRASEALVAMDMKHPVSSAHQVFPQIKSDMMYSHPAISSSTAAGTSISRSSNQVRYQTNEDPLVFDTLPTLKSQDCNGCTASSVRRVLAISHTLLPTGVGNG